MRMVRKFGGLALVLALGACSADTGNNSAASTLPDPANATATVQPLPPATGNDYPPCSTTVKDHCVEK